MLHTFSLLERGREAHHAKLQELVFKVYGRRNQLFVQWAARAMGYDDEVAESYVRDVLDEIFGDADAGRLLTRVGKDLERAGLRHNDVRLLEKLYEIEGAACGVVMAEINGNVVVPFRRVHRSTSESAAPAQPAELTSIDSALKQAKAELAVHSEIKFRDMFLTVVDRDYTPQTAEAAE